MKAKRRQVRIPAAIARRLSVVASVDPRTLVAVACGAPVIGLARERAARALAAAGLLTPKDGNAAVAAAAEPTTAGVVCADPNRSTE